MAELPSLPLFTDAWVADTAHLSRLERGIYHDLLVLIWRTPDCRVPNEIEWIIRKLRCDETEAKILKSIIVEFCQSTGNWLTQKRLKKEYERALAGKKKQSVRAKSRWNKEKDEYRGTTENTADAMPPIPNSNSRDTLSTSQPTTPREAEMSLDWGDLETKLREAAGWQNEPHPNLAIVGPIVELLRNGADLELDVLPVISATAHKSHSRSGWKFFIPAIREAMAARLAAAKPLNFQSTERSHAAHRTNGAGPTIRDGFSYVRTAIDELERRENEARGADGETNPVLVS